MQYDFILEEKEAQAGIAIRTRTAVENLPQVLGVAYGAIMSYLDEMAVQPAGAPYVGYFNTDMRDLDIECGFTLAQALPGRQEIKPSAIPAGKRVSCLHSGPYSQVEPVYNAITEWIAANGHTSTGVFYEHYLNDPAETPENELLTKIVFLLE